MNIPIQAKTRLKRATQRIEARSKAADRSVRSTRRRATREMIFVYFRTPGRYHAGAEFIGGRILPDEAQEPIHTHNFDRPVGWAGSGTRRDKLRRHLCFRR